MIDAGPILSTRGIVPLLGIFLTSDRSRSRLQGQLAAAGWRTVLLPAPATGMRAWIDQPIDALLVAPFDGWEEPRGLIALARAVAGGRPLMVLTSGRSRDQRLLAFEAGADDAIDRDADPREVTARLASLLRRYRSAGGRIECAELTIDLIERRAARCGNLMRLPLREFDLLANLVRAAGQIVPRQTLLRAVWKIDFDPGTNRLDVHMSRLRAKVDRGYAWPMLMTERGYGYGIRCAPDAL